MALLGRSERFHGWKAGVLLFLTITLTACGSTALADATSSPAPSASATPTITDTPAATAVPTTTTSPTAAPSATASPSPGILSCSNYSPKALTFCETPAEEAEGQVPVEMTTVPVGLFISENVSLTSAPAKLASITEAQAESIALQHVGDVLPDSQVDEAVLADWHTAEGQPTNGNIFWVVNVAPPGGFTFDGRECTWCIATIDAQTGDYTGLLIA